MSFPHARPPVLAALLVLVGAAAASGQQPIGTAVHESSALAPTAVGTAPASTQRAEPPLGLPPTTAERAQRRGVQVAPAQVLPEVLDIVSRAAGDTIEIAVRTSGEAPWSLSEPYYLHDRVRLHLDVAAAHAPSLEVPAATGALTAISVSGEGQGTRLLIDVARLSGYTASEADGLVTVRITTTAAAAAANGAEIARSGVAPVSVGTQRVASAAASAAISRARSAAARHGSLLLDPANRGMTATALGVLLALAGAVVVRLIARRSRPAPRSVVLGTMPPAAAHAECAATPAPRPTLADPAAAAVGVRATAPAPVRVGGRRSKHGPVTAHSLAAAGLSRGEIAARLRTSRDAVNLLLATAPGPDDAAGSGRNFPAGPAPRGRRLFGIRR